jgi:hypothetical protein
MDLARTKIGILAWNGNVPESNYGYDRDMSPLIAATGHATLRETDGSDLPLRLHTGTEGELAAGEELKLWLGRGWYELRSWWHCDRMGNTSGWDRLYVLGVPDDAQAQPEVFVIFHDCRCCTYSLEDKIHTHARVAGMQPSRDWLGSHHFSHKLTRPKRGSGLIRIDTTADFNGEEPSPELKLELPQAEAMVALHRELERQDRFYLSSSLESPESIGEGIILEDFVNDLRETGRLSLLGRDRSRRSRRRRSRSKDCRKFLAEGRKADGEAAEEIASERREFSERNGRLSRPAPLDLSDEDREVRQEMEDDWYELEEERAFNDLLGPRAYEPSWFALQKYVSLEVRFDPALIDALLPELLQLFSKNVYGMEGVDVEFAEYLAEKPSTHKA